MGVAIDREPKSSKVRKNILKQKTLKEERSGLWCGKTEYQANAIQKNLHLNYVAGETGGRTNRKGGGTQAGMSPL